MSDAPAYRVGQRIGLFVLPAGKEKPIAKSAVVSAVRKGVVHLGKAGKIRDDGTVDGPDYPGAPYVIAFPTPEEATSRCLDYIAWHRLLSDLRLTSSTHWLTTCDDNIEAARVFLGLPSRPEGDRA